MKYKNKNKNKKNKKKKDWYFLDQLYPIFQILHVKILYFLRQIHQYFLLKKQLNLNNMIILK